MKPMKLSNLLSSLSSSTMHCFLDPAFKVPGVSRLGIALKRDMHRMFVEYVEFEPGAILARSLFFQNGFEPVLKCDSEIYSEYARFRAVMQKLCGNHIALEEVLFVHAVQEDGDDG